MRAAARQVVSAGGGGSGGAGGGVVPPDDACDYTTTPCDAGFSCLPSVLDDGGSGRRCLAGPCDLYTQDCSVGFKCAYGDGGRTCLPEGTLDEGVPCVGAPSGCKKGLVCTLAGGADGGSACSRFCRDTDDCAMPQQCYVSLVQSDTRERPLVCAPAPLSCDPLLQDCVDAADGCYPGSGDPGCFPAGPLVEGNACSFSNDCAKGLACVGAATSRSCRTICGFVSGTPGCPTGTGCTRLTSSMTIGVCL